MALIERASDAFQQPTGQWIRPVCDYCDAAVLAVLVAKRLPPLRLAPVLVCTRCEREQAEATKYRSAR